jgi:hypothetical protein
MADYTVAVKRPFQDIKKLLIGTVIEVIPVVNFIAMGYHLNCAKTAMKKEHALPEWEDWGGLFTNGLMIFIAMMVYMAPAAVVMVVGMGASFVGGGMGFMMGAKTGWMPTLVGLGLSAILAVILCLVAVYLMPAAVLNFAKGGKFGDFFDFKSVVNNAKRWSYLKALVFSAFYMLIAVIILSVVPVVGSALGVFAAGVTAYTIFGEVYEGI